MVSTTGVSITGVSIRGASSASRPTNSYSVTRMLQQIGKKDNVLDTVALKRAGLGQAFSSFDMTSVTPGELGLVSKNLYALGLIDKTTSNLLISAGTSLDSLGNQTLPNKKMNALEYFAARINSLNNASVGNDQYAFHVVPDYINTVYVLQNLNDFAKDQRAGSNTQTSIGRQILSGQSSGLSVKV